MRSPTVYGKKIAEALARGLCILMQVGIHEIAANVIVHKASASVVFLCLFIMVSILYVEFLYFIC
jgi:hypothetical protein